MEWKFMPWEEKTKETMRKEFVKEVLLHKESKSALCKKYGISRPTGDKWIVRYMTGESLTDQSKEPLNKPNKTNTEIEKIIVEYRKQYPAIGALKIHRMLKDEGYTALPSVKTVNTIFKRNGLITKEASLASTPQKSFVKSYPNEMLQADFKGHFLMKDGNRCHPLNIIDDYSRFSLCCTPLLSETFDEVYEQFERVFKEYGMPFSLLCDNGNPWGTSQSTGFSRFEVKLMELGILVLHGRIRHPQTQGKQERFNGSFTRECLKLNTFEDQADAARKFEEYRTFYNTKRPHRALNLMVPEKIYQPSPLKYPEKIEEWEYPSECTVHSVKRTGYITIKGQGYFLSEALGDKQIAFRESAKGVNFINLYFRQFQIGQIDIDKRVFTFKKAYLIEGDPRR